MRSLLTLFVLVVSVSHLTQAQAPAFPDTYAITGARIEVGDGRVIPRGTVLIRDGIILAVGADVKAPPEAEIIKGDGLTVYPGFIDGFCVKGLKLPDPQPDQDVPPDRAAGAPPFMREANRKGIRPEIRACDHLSLSGDILNPLREAGFAAAALAPTGGMINGRATLIHLSGLPKRDSVILPEAALGFAFKTFGESYPATLLGVFSQIRQTLLDARRSRLVHVSFRRGSAVRQPVDDSLAALLPALDGEIPAAFEADREQEILRAVKLMDEFGLKPIIAGGLEAWKVAPTLAARHIPVLLALNFGEEPGGEKPKPEAGQLPANKPAPVGQSSENQKPAPGASEGSKVETPEVDPDWAEMPEAAQKDAKRKWDEKVANARQLARAGVTFAFSTRGMKDPQEFLRNLRRAVKAGLPRDAALKALTYDAARIFGVERQIGTVEAGKTASLVVMSGDFADEKTKVKYLFIDRKKIDPEREKEMEKPAGAPGERSGHE